MVGPIYVYSRYGNKMGFVKTIVVAIVKTQTVRWDNFSLCECWGGGGEEEGKKQKSPVLDEVKEKKQAN